MLKSQIFLVYWLEIFTGVVGVHYWTNVNKLLERCKKQLTSQKSCNRKKWVERENRIVDSDDGDEGEREQDIDEETNFQQHTFFRYYWLSNRKTQLDLKRWKIETIIWFFAKISRVDWRQGPKTLRIINPNFQNYI